MKHSRLIFIILFLTFFWTQCLSKSIDNQIKESQGERVEAFFRGNCLPKGSSVPGTFIPKCRECCSQKCVYVMEYICA